jgi:hypothetical protein
MFAWKAEGFSECEAHSDSHRCVPLSSQSKLLDNVSEAQSATVNKQRPLFLPGEVA